MKRNVSKESKIIVYQGKSGAIELRGDFAHETIWATQAQICKLFSIDRSVVTKHISNIVKVKEVNEKSNVQKMHITHSDKPVSFYSLDIVLAVGYRVNSTRAIQFRRWVTKILREHITKGYTINTRIIKNNYNEFQKAIENIKYLLPRGTMIDQVSVVELVSSFADTWLSLDAYDKGTLIDSGVSKRSVSITTEQLEEALKDFKKELLEKKKITEIFGQERQKESIAGIVGNVMQSLNNKQLYPTIEEKATHLLYFIVKNHPFVDGNKRCGAFAFIWFLKKTGVLDISKITPQALTVLTLLIAESNPKRKDTMIRLVLQLLKK